MFLCQVCRVLSPNEYSTIWISTNLAQANLILKEILSLFSIKFLSCKNSIINALQLNSFSIKIANTTSQLKVLQLPISLFSHPLQIVKCSTPVEWWNVVTYGLKEDIYSIYHNSGASASQDPRVRPAPLKAKDRC